MDIEAAGAVRYTPAVRIGWCACGTKV